MLVDKHWREWLFHSRTGVGVGVRNSSGVGVSGNGSGSKKSFGSGFGSGILLSEFCISLAWPESHYILVYKVIYRTDVLKTYHKINYFFQKTVYDKD
jgi:hypothetical protein